VVDFPKLMEEIGQMFFPSAREKKIEMYFTGMDQVPRLIKTDRIKLSQILINLIQNALIFTNAGAINIDVKTKACNSENGAERQSICFSVKDTGCGIDPENIKTIFEPFTQIQSKIAPGAGTGLGLAVCKNYVSMMGGRLWVKSTPGKGSVFSFFIPLTTVDTASENEISSLAQPDSLKKTFEEKSENHGLGNGEIADRISSIPDSIIEQLKDAVLKADADSVISAIILIENHDPELSDILYDLADAFEYERLLEFCTH
jgi:anti-sigma regulatory factor (Ser/Thr protein kinase)